MKIWWDGKGPPFSLCFGSQLTCRSIRSSKKSSTFQHSGSLVKSWIWKNSIIFLTWGFIWAWVFLLVIRFNLLSFSLVIKLFRVFLVGRWSVSSVRWGFLWSNLKCEALLASEGLPVIILCSRTGDECDWLRRWDDFRLHLSVQTLCCVIAFVNWIFIFSRKTTISFGEPQIGAAKVLKLGIISAK